MTDIISNKVVKQKEIDESKYAVTSPSSLALEYSSRNMPSDATAAFATACSEMFSHCSFNGSVNVSFNVCSNERR
jgi:hypothetical protein